MKYLGGGYSAGSTSVTMSAMHIGLETGTLVLTSEPSEVVISSTSDARAKLTIRNGEIPENTLGIDLRTALHEAQQPLLQQCDQATSGHAYEEAHSLALALEEVQAAQTASFPAQSDWADLELTRPVPQAVAATVKFQLGEFGDRTIITPAQQALYGRSGLVIEGGRVTENNLPRRQLDALNSVADD